MEDGYVTCDNTWHPERPEPKVAEVLNERLNSSYDEHVSDDYRRGYQDALKDVAASLGIGTRTRTEFYPW